MPATPHDLAIIGAGPAGCAAAITAASAGLRVVLLERASFPREKICGDCLNPAVWQELDRLGVRGLQLAGGRALHRVVFGELNGRCHEINLPPTPATPEYAVKRSVLDLLLAERAQAVGADLRFDTTLTAIEEGQTWELATRRGSVRAKMLLAADGRNSTVASLRRIRPRARDQRVAFQTHLADSAIEAGTVQLHLHRAGYAGLADVGGGVTNLCLVSPPREVIAIRKWAADRFRVRTTAAWRSITPIARADLRSPHPRLLFAGDARRVVEPFTGEGIYYALGSGRRAAEVWVKMAANHCADARPPYERALRSLYGHRLWWNQLAHLAVVYPRLGSFTFAAAARFGWLNLLTTKVVQPLPPLMKPCRETLSG